MPRKVSSPLFVGREAELDRFAATIAAARDGDGQLFLVAGEAGVGKSRLLEEAMRRASADGVLVAIGRCFGPGSSAVPFGPIREALRAVAAAAGPPGDGAGARPSIDAFLPVGLESALAPERIGVGPDTSQARAFQACLELLGAASRDRPVLLVIEDVHWADRSTLDLLGFLAAGLTDARIVIVASFRSDELYRGHPLHAFLGEVQRSRATERIDLARFTRDEAARQVGAILGESAREDVIDRVFQRSDGIAFYVEEVLAAETSGTGLPPAMRDILLARVAALSVPAQELLRTVAAGGLRIPTAVVARVAEVGPDAVARFVREASDRHLVTVGDADGIEFVAFRHALVQEAVYAELLPGERSRLHAAYATALESAGAFWQDPAAQLAYHWFAAHDIPRALAASVEAGRRAAAGYAYADAHAHYEHALELWDRVPDAAERTGLDRIALLELGGSVAAQSDPARAAALLREAIEAAGPDADRTRLALLKERYARYAWMAGDGVTATEACREAAALVPDDAPMTARARVLASLGQILMVTRPTDEARPVSERAVAAARAAGDAEIEAHALDTLGVMNVYLGNLAQGRSQVEAAIDLAIRIGSVDEASRAKSNLVDVLAHSALLSEVEDATVSAYAYAVQHGLARNMGVFALAEGGLALYRYGRWDRAEDLFALASPHALSGAPLIMVQERLAMIDVGRGRFDAAAARFAVARPLIDRVVEAQFVSPMAEAAAELALWRGDPLGARAEIAALFDRLDVVPAYISRLGPLLALGVRAEADASQVARPRRDTAALEASDAIVRAHLDAMRALHAEATGRRRNFLSQAEAWLALCEAEAARQAGSDEPAVWARAAAAFEAIPMPYPASYARWRGAAAILAVSRDRGAAAAEARAALDGAQALGARPLVGAIEGLMARARLELVSPHPGAGARALAKPGDELGLTRREREILALVAVGRSNRQIAEALFITEGTAGTHVSNILGKLGVRGRTEAASLAHRLGIVDEA